MMSIADGDEGSDEAAGGVVPLAFDSDIRDSMQGKEPEPGEWGTNPMHGNSALRASLMGALSLSLW
jgi:hypothetical protein